MSKIHLTRRTIEFVEPDNSEIDFIEVLERANPSRKTWIGRIRAIFSSTITVAVPLELRKEFPSGMTKMNGQPLWTYKLVDGTVYALKPQPEISYS